MLKWLWICKSDDPICWSTFKWLFSSIGNAIFPKSFSMFIWFPSQHFPGYTLEMRFSQRSKSQSTLLHCLFFLGDVICPKRNSLFILFPSQHFLGYTLEIRFSIKVISLCVFWVQLCYLGFHWRCDFQKFRVFLGWKTQLRFVFISQCIYLVEPYLSTMDFNCRIYLPTK